MSLSAKIREQLISSFRAELAEHIQTMTDGLLALEQGTLAGEARPELAEGARQSTLDEIFRAAHSLKGAARAVGVTAIEQLAHALEDILDAMRRAPDEDSTIELTPELFTVCYRGLDAIQAVQAAYEAGETTPPSQALQALADLEAFRPSAGSGGGPSALRQARDAAGSGRDRAAQDAADSERAPRIQEAAPPPASGEPIRVRWDPGERTVTLPVDEPSAPAQATADPAANAQYPISNLQSPLPDETIRVSASKLDALMAQLSELLVTKIHAEQRLAQVRRAQEFTALWRKDWMEVRGAFSRLARRHEDISSALGVAPSRWPEIPFRVDSAQKTPRLFQGDDGAAAMAKDMLHLLDYVGLNQERLRDMHALMNDLARQYADDTLYMSLVIDDLEREIKRTRMLPLSTITATFGRMVRDLAHDAAKEARLQIIGGDTELDKRVLEQIKDPLIHLLRNAIHHGIEPPEQREMLGKPRQGTVTLKAEQLGQDVVVSVADDGTGLDLGAIRRAVARQGGADTQALSAEDLKELIFNAGISTSPIITDISGRGVGLDVVRRNVEALHGRIDVDWAPGAGTTFTLTLPLTLTSSRGLLVRVSGELFAIPLNAIERIEYISPQDISPLEGHDTIRYNGRPLTLVRLNDVLELPAPPSPPPPAGGAGGGHIPVVILAAAERRMAFAVDAWENEQEIVIKGLGKQLSRVGGIAGATVMGNGEVALILNVADLIKLAMRGERRSVFERVVETVSFAERRAQQRILVVDDSITTRTLEKNILEAAGYTVQLAIDGREALSAIAADGVPDLIVSDIAMPRLDGFELTQQIKGDTRTAGVPVVLVTSLDSPRDKARGIEVGADAYIVKSSFDQNNLLETIEQLI